MKGLLIGSIVFLLLSLPPLATAASIFTSNSSGGETTNFYSNDTVYVASSANISATTSTIRFYIATHRSWSTGANLTTSSIFSRNITTNSSGHVPVTLLWSPTLTVGVFDLIADVNWNGTFDSEDQLYSAAGGGFAVFEPPVPSLNITKGVKSPSNHDWHVETNGSQKNVMLQINITASSYDSVKVTSFALTAYGTGDEKTGVSLVAIYLDDGNGSYDQTDSIIGYGQYLRDDGIVSFDTTNRLMVNANASIALIFVYTMTNSSGSAAGSTYSFQLVSADAIGTNTGIRATVTGLPIVSAVKTVYAAEATTTTTAPATTTTQVAVTTTTTAPKEETKDLIVGLAIAGFVVVAILTLAYFFVLKSSQTPQYVSQ